MNVASVTVTAMNHGLISGGLIGFGMTAFQ
jgi:hypothetical protein